MISARRALAANRYSDLQRGDPEVLRTLEFVQSIYLPFAALAELRVGFAGGRRPRENERFLRRFLSRHDVNVLYANEDTTRHYAAIYHQLRRKGTPILTKDIWIAALALQHALTLYARDAHFDQLRQLARL